MRVLANDRENAVKNLFCFSSNLRQEAERSKAKDINVGPDDAYLLITDDELTTHNQKEIARLKDALGKAEAELEGQRISVSFPFWKSFDLNMIHSRN